METKLAAFERLLEVMDTLRVECPWDRKQTFESLRNNTVEETFELIDALNNNDLANIKEELGDLLLHIVFYSKIAEEQQAFNIADVSNAIADKLIFRHPHVFGGDKAENEEQVTKKWEELKLEEKKKKNQKLSVLSGVPRSLPAMIKAYRIGHKAASAGYDWKNKSDVWTKVEEEYKELHQGIDNNDRANTEEEFGDLFFALINAARLYDVDPEAALQKCNNKFIRRFSHIEDRAHESNRELKDMTLEQMEEYWQEAKVKEKQDKQQ
ncbi:MAG: nucleoside triphosphate pyrophosphohydrolase [Rikenellaceae bacterium]